MNDTVATKAQDTLTSATSPELAVVIGTRTVEYHQGQRSYTAPTGRTYDPSRPKRSERRKPLAKRPSTYGGAVEAPGQDVQEKAPDELVRVKPHGLPAARTVDAIVFPAERDAGVVGCDEAAVRDGDTVGVVLHRHPIDAWTGRTSL